MPAGRISRVRSRARGAAIGAAGLLRAIRDDDEDTLLESLAALTRRRRVLAPLTFALGGLALLLHGLRLLLTNWRLLLIQVLPAIWIWLAMFDLKLHVLHGHSFDTIRGAVLIPIFALIISITVAGFFLNAVFAFAIVDSPPQIRPAVDRARAHIVAVVISGSLLGLLLAVATTISPRWSSPWFALSLGVVVALMMISYVAVPARLIGVRSTQSRRDRLTSSAVGGALGATVCTPPYLLGRIGLLMLGTHYLRIPGIVVFSVGVALQAGATGAVRAIKMSTRLSVGAAAAPPDRQPEAPAPQ